MIGRAGLWLGGVILLAVILAVLAISGRLQVHSDLLALLPAPQRNPVKAAVMERIAELGRQRLVVLVDAGGAQSNQRAASAAAQALARSDAFVEVLYRTDDLLDSSRRDVARTIVSEHRFHLLAPADSEALAHLATPPLGDDRAALHHFLDRARARLYGIAIGAGGSRFIDDPLGLSAAYRESLLSGLAVPGLHLGSNGHFYVANEQGRRYATIFAQSKADPFTLEAQAAQLAALEQARNAARTVAPGANLLVSGVLPHAAAATEQARHEVSVIGFGSLAGILLLVFWAFGSIRPFLLGLLVMAGGSLLALVVTTAWFGRIHVITLVFGASIAGVAIDYCLHFFAQRWDTPAPRLALRCIFPAITLGLVANVLAYGAMAVAPFPGMRQMAVFAVFGLIGAWLGVILLLPAGAGPPPRPGTALRLAQRWLEHGPARAATHRNRLLWCMGGAVLVLLTLSAMYLSPNDDIGLLYNAPPELQQVDRQVSHLLGAHPTGETIAVRGDTPTAVLDAEAELVDALGGATPIVEVSAITEAYPTPTEQRRDYARLALTLYAHGGLVQQLLSEAGYSIGRIDEHLEAFAAQQGRVLGFQQWLASPASRGWRRLWLGRIDKQWVSLVRVLEVHDGQALARVLAQHPQAVDIDPKAQISRIFKRYRELSTGLLGVAYLLALLLLSRPLGARGAVSVIVPPMLASAMVAAVYAVTGWPFSLFNVIAMILLLGLGADYGIFLRMAGQHSASAMLAVGASTATNLLAFGLLALSATPALHSFGLTLALGLALTFVLTSLAGGQEPNRSPGSI